jgi:uncharacterized protein
MTFVAFPYGLDSRGRTLTTDYADHVEQMIVQLLLTRAGERVNQPDLGCGAGDDVFGPNSPEIALDITITAAVQRWLSDVIALTGLDVTSNASTLTVQLSYVILATGQSTATVVTVPGPI